MIRAAVVKGILIPALLAAAAGAALAGEAVVLPAAPAFRPPLADPMEPHWGILDRTGVNYFRLNLGQDWDLARWSDPGDSASLGFLAGAAFQIHRVDWATYLVRADDWDFGIYAARRHGNVSCRVEYRNESSHLGDVLFNSTSALDYRRQGLRLTGVWEPLPWARVNAGMGWWFFQSFSRPRAEFQAGFELYGPSWKAAGGDLRGYLACELADPGQGTGVLNSDLQLGLQLGKQGEGPGATSMRLALVYHAGNSLFGQFYRQRDDHWGFGLFFDP